MKISKLFGLLTLVSTLMMSGIASANYNVTIASTGGRAVYAIYPVGDGHVNSKGFVAGYMELFVAGKGTISFNDISGTPCASWAVAITHAGKVYTYYYEGAGQIVVAFDVNGNLKLSTPNGKIINKVAGICA